MKIIEKIADLREELRVVGNKKVGLVPTMGYFHEGHLSLIREAQKENDIKVVSIFVNPTQFGPKEDFKQYPRDINRDLKLLKKLEVDFVFKPAVGEIYPEGYLTYVSVEKLGQVLCGKSRPVHFRGVTTVVLKLFNIVRPDIAYFGQKDAQQAIIIKQMVADLNLNMNIKVMPIIRDKDGLALSSRNTYLSSQQRQAAILLPRALSQARFVINEGEHESKRIIYKIKNILESNKLVKIDYIKIVGLNNLEDLREIKKDNTLVAIAIKVGETRLIDNFILGEI